MRSLAKVLNRILVLFFTLGSGTSSDYDDIRKCEGSLTLITTTVQCPRNSPYFRHFPDSFQDEYLIDPDGQEMCHFLETEQSVLVQ
jgi:hypothetical protein